jgi:fluoride exporter
MTKLLMIAAGGAAGTLLRYLVSALVQGWAGPRFPAGTLAVNATGCFAVGFLAVFLAGPGREEWRAPVLVGVLGGYTTFSAFGWQTVALARDGQWPLAALNILLSNGCGLLAVWLGLALGQRTAAAP